MTKPQIVYLTQSFGNLFHAFQSWWTLGRSRLRSHSRHCIRADRCIWHLHVQACIWM